MNNVLVPPDDYPFALENCGCEVGKMLRVVASIMADDDAVRSCIW